MPPVSPAPPLSLYIHLPWCVRKCPYCDFNSWTAGSSLPRGRYVEALCAELAHEAESTAGRPVVSVFLGGGTPSLFEPEEIGTLLAEVGRRFRLVDDAEITMEANPGTVECGDPAGYRAAGVNRLSIGAQSFDDGRLAVLGRVHVAADTVRAVDAARAAGFDNINLDLMYALPGQGPADALSDIRAAAVLAPEHISWYHLTLEPNTVFYARPPEGLPDDETSYAIQCEGEALLDSLGYPRYEVSAWSKPGHECRHNLNYWTFGDYAAAGAGAHGKITTGDGVFRYSREQHPVAWMQAVESGRDSPRSPALRPDELVFEFMLNATRLEAGFDDTLFTDRTGLPAAMLRERLDAAAGRGLIESDGGDHWQPTGLGRRFLNDLQAHFLPAPADPGGFMHSTRGRL